MKKGTCFSLSLLAWASINCCIAQAQLIFSRFDFNVAPFTTASIGPNATAIDADVIGDGNAIYIGANCGATKGIDLTIPNTASIFDQPEMGMTFRFRKLESRSDFFDRGGTQFYQTGGDLMVAYRTTDGAFGFIDYGPYNTGFALDEDGLFHIYTFIYTSATGIATVWVDGGLVWSQDGPDNRDFYWVGAPDPIVGTVMDGNCNGLGILDYAYFFIPVDPLPIEFQSFEVDVVGENAVLEWTASNEMFNSRYEVARSRDGVTFTTIGIETATGGGEPHTYSFTDAKPGGGLFYYRIQHVAGDGSFTQSAIQEATFQVAEGPSMQLWPNPISRSQGPLHLLLGNVAQDEEITLSRIDGGGIIVVVSPPDEVLQLDVSTLEAGIYLLRCACNGQPLVKKVVVQ